MTRGCLNVTLHPTLVSFSCSASVLCMISVVDITILTCHLQPQSSWYFPCSRAYTATWVIANLITSSFLPKLMFLGCFTANAESSSDMCLYLLQETLTQFSFASISRHCNLRCWLYIFLDLS